MVSTFVLQVGKVDEQQTIYCGLLLRWFVGRWYWQFIDFRYFNKGFWECINNNNNNNSNSSNNNNNNNNNNNVVVSS